MISQAVYELLNVVSITSLATGGVYPVLAPQGASFPFIVWNEKGTPENFKDGSDITYYDVQIDVYASKGKDGAGGFLLVEQIGDAVISELDRYKGTIGGSVIQQTVLESTEILYDPISEAARQILEFRFRILE